MAVKIITKKQTIVFVVIFLFISAGYILTDNAIEQRKFLSDLENREVVISGTADQIKENQYGFNIYLTNVDIKGKHCNQLIVQCDDNPNIKIGTKIIAEGKVSQFEEKRNKGNFDSKKYYMSLGIFAKLKADNIKRLNYDYDVVRERLYIFKTEAELRLKNICGGKYSGIKSLCNDKASVFSTILLGDKKDLDNELKELYSSSGIAHILAISGLHISLIGMFIYSMLRRRFKFALSASASIIVVLLFGIMSGMGIATVRAVIMFVLRLIGEVLGRTYDYLTAMSTAGIMLMMWNPFVILNSGFQMSFAAVIAIAIIWPVVCGVLDIKNNISKEKRICEKNITAWQKIKIMIAGFAKKLLKAMLFSINISLVLNPIIACNYFEIPTYSFLLNVIVVPLMPIVVISGIAGIGMSFFSITIGRICVLPGCAVLELYSKLCLIFKKLPFSNVIVGEISIAAIIVYYVLFITILVAAYYIRKKKNFEEKQKSIITDKKGLELKELYLYKKQKSKYNIRFAFVLAGMLIFINIFIYIESHFKSTSMVCKNGLQVTFLDVGQGDGIFMRIGDVNMTVDGGSSSVDNVGKYRIIPFLKSEAVRYVDYAVVTHTDTDHINGLLEMIKQSDNNGIKLKNIVMPDIGSKDEVYNNLVLEAYRHGINVLYIKKGSKFKIKDVEINCVYPKEKMLSEDKNDLSVVLSVQYNKFSMLLTGDISSIPEKAISDYICEHYTVLKVAHHGSKYSTSGDFLEKTMPEYSVISVGEYNLYGHPSAEVLERLKKAGSKVLRTDESGGITVKTDGEKIAIEKSIE